MCIPDYPGTVIFLNIICIPNQFLIVWQGKIKVEDTLKDMNSAVWVKVEKSFARVIPPLHGGMTLANNCKCLWKKEGLGERRDDGRISI